MGRRKGGRNKLKGCESYFIPLLVVLFLIEKQEEICHNKFLIS